MSEKWHVLPVNDLYDHKDTDMDCKCNPKLERQPNGNWLIIHKSYDRREDSEPDAVTNLVSN